MTKSILHRLMIRLTWSLLGILLIPPAGLALYWWTTFPDVKSLTTVNPATTAFIEARQAEAREHAPAPPPPQQIWVPLDEISPHLQAAVIVSEDASFYFHEGFDWEGIKEAVLRNVTAGTLHRGGSTITQQLAKNLYLSSGKTLLRKANEALITWAMERHVPKKRILEIYLNVAEWGKGVYGAEAAAQYHFGKSAKDLSPEEAALLAAMLPSPRSHDPLQVTKYLAVRQRHILTWMEKRQGTKAVTGQSESPQIGPLKEKPLPQIEPVPPPPPPASPQETD